MTETSSFLYSSSYILSIGFPTSASVIGYTDEQVKTTFRMTKDIRDKYVGPRLFWDLGILDEIADITFASEKL